MSSYSSYRDRSSPLLQQALSFKLQVSLAPGMNVSPGKHRAVVYTSNRDLYTTHFPILWVTEVLKSHLVVKPIFMNLSHNIPVPDIHGIYSSRSLVYTSNLAKVYRGREILREGNRDHISSISTENRDYRS